MTGTLGYGGLPERRNDSIVSPTALGKRIDMITDLIRRCDPRERFSRQLSRAPE